MHDSIPIWIALPVSFILVVLLLASLRRDKVARDKALRLAGYYPKSARERYSRTDAYSTPPVITTPTPGGTTQPPIRKLHIVTSQLDKDDA